ncbi:MAG: hypothetical protein IJC53_00380 [Clostridia bacterium]|nr:hypothetical protein [Clostridia bacterium]
MTDTKRPHSLRVAYENWMYEDRFEHLLRLLSEYDCGFSTVALFTSAVHTPLLLPEVERRAAVLADRVERLRAAGFRAGINHLPTVGHHCEDLDHSWGDGYHFMTNIKGEVCRGSYCMRDERFRADCVVPTYQMLAAARPDFIWIDDDLRLGHMPIGKACFCDGCISAFNAEHGTAYTRESLHAALSEFDPTLRKKWLAHNEKAICDLLQTIGRTVRAVDESIVLGAMTGEHYFEGYDFARRSEALSEGGKYEIMWRPGGGAYEDFNFESIVQKVEGIGRQNAYMPDYVTTIHHEIENFPYQTIKKTPRSTALEAIMAMTVGCTGAAFNILPSETGESLDNIRGHLAAIEKIRPFCETAARLFEGLSPEGIHSGWRPDSQAAVPEGDYTSRNGMCFSTYNRELFFCGLPECYHKDKASVVTMTGTAAGIMDDAEVEKLLSGGIYLDPDAIAYLSSRGFGDRIGFSVEKEIPVDAMERYVQHPINEGIVGGLRNCRQAFHFGPSFLLYPEKESCEILSELIDYHENIWGPCASGLYENDLGGRVLCAGYYPFDWCSDQQKAQQLRNIFLWLSHGTLPSFVESYHRVRNYTLTGEGRICVTLTNTSNDEITGLSLAVRTDKPTARLHTMFDGECGLCAARGENLYGGEYTFFEIDRIPPFETVIVEL